MNIFDHILSATESSDLETNKCAANNSEQLQVVFNEIDAYQDYTTKSHCILYSNLFHRQIPISKTYQPTEPECIYNSQYGNGMPAILTFYCSPAER